MNKPIKFVDLPKTIQEELITKARSQHSVYWLGDEAENMLYDLEFGSVEHIARLRNIQRVVSNFVQIVTGKNIPVIYSSGEQSYTDGKKVVLSAFLDPTLIDVQVGLALHEASHCHLSNQSLLFLERKIRYNEELLKNSTIVKDAAKIGMTQEDVDKFICLMMNYLEDRRIDLWMYKNASGYRPYYQALYKHYWHSSVVDRALADPLYRTPSIDNYELHILNMTNSNWDSNALPGLKEIREIVDFTESGLFARGDSDPNWKTWYTLSGINYNALPKLWADALKISEIVVKNSTEFKRKETKNDNNKNRKRVVYRADGYPNMDFSPAGGCSGDVEFVPVTPEELEEAIKNQKGFLDHSKMNKDKQALDSSVANHMQALEDSKAEFKTARGNFVGKAVKCPIIIYRNITKNTVRNNKFPMSFSSHGSLNQNSIQAIKDGTRMGQILAHKISIIQDEKPLKFPHQKTGKIDKRMIAALGFDKATVFYHDIIEASKPVNVWLDVDLSGSMAGEKYQRAMALALAIAYAAEKNRKMNCIIATRNSGHQHANIAIIYDSRKHRFNQIKSVVPYIGASGGTPEALCFEAVKDEILDISKDKYSKKYFINISDGEPSHVFTWRGTHYSYGGEEAYTHTRCMMQEFRAAGIDILSYYIGSTEAQDGFKRMYGTDAHYINPESIPAIANTLNKLITDKTI